MALHSMCHPGRPGPQGDPQVGSPGLADFHRAKSEGLRFLLSRATRSPARLSSYAHAPHGTDKWAITISDAVQGVIQIICLLTLQDASNTSYLRA